MSSENGKRNLAFFLAGAAVGAGLGLLFAPKSGKETREQLADWLKKRREAGGELLTKIKEEIPAKKEQLVAAIRAGKQAYQEAATKHNSHKESVSA